MIWSQGSPDHPSGFFSASFFKCASDSSSVTEGRTSDTAVHTERVKLARPAGSQPLVLTRWGPSSSRCAERKTQSVETAAWVSQLEGIRCGFKSGAFGRSPWLPTALCCQEYQRPNPLFSLTRLWKEHKLPFLEGSLEHKASLGLCKSPSPLET